MTRFDPEKFEEKYVHYFDELERAYSEAYQRLHGRYDSELLRAVDRQILSASEPTYEGGEEFSVALPEDLDERLESLPADEAELVPVLEEFVGEIERQLARIFEFDD